MRILKFIFIFFITSSLYGMSELHPTKLDETRLPLRNAILSNDFMKVITLLQKIQSVPPLVDLYKLYNYHPQFDLRIMHYIFLKYNTDTNATTKNLDTPLHYAAATGNIEAIEALMQMYPISNHEAKLNAQNIHKKTPLDYALKFNQAEAVKELSFYAQKAKESMIAQLILIEHKRMLNKIRPARKAVSPLPHSSIPTLPPLVKHAAPAQVRSRSQFR